MSAPAEGALGPTEGLRTGNPGGEDRIVRVLGRQVCGRLGSKVVELDSGHSLVNPSGDLFGNPERVAFE